mmetsp:Transcript_3600/g.11240  ORF Transcript_3600/g.11240 Transcript_3600/m.11240 type:complete len:238 (+) Transcript_3600:480-1193(+)
MSVSTKMTHSLPLSESFASLVRAFIEFRICPAAESVCSPMSSISLSCTLSSELISSEMSFIRLTVDEIESSCVSCSAMIIACFCVSSPMNRLLSAAASLSIVIATLEPDALSAERSDSRSVPAFLAAFFVTELVFEAADSAGSVLATSALIMEMLLCVLSTKCFRESTSSSLRPNLARLDSTILIVSSRSCRSHSMERKPDSSSDLVHSYSSLSFPVADLRISFHRLCNSWTTVSEC